MSGSNVIGFADSSNGALSFAKSATDTFFFIDFVFHKVFTNVRGAFFIDDMRNVFVLKVRKRR